MVDPLHFVFLQCLVAGAGLVLLLFWKQTAYLGITCLFAFQVSSASLSAFFFGRLFGMREAWITEYHEQVLIYSGWMILAIVAGMWLAWWPSMKKRQENGRISDGSFPWVSEQFIYFALALGAIATIAAPFVLFSVPTVGTAVNLLASWLKIGLIASVVLFKKKGTVRPLLIATALFVPAALINALRSGHTPLSVDAIICIALIATCLDRVTIWSFVKLFLCMLPCVYLMFAWLASRGVIRSGELEQFSMGERASRFADVFVKELGTLQVTAYDVQNLIFERIDMTELLSQEAQFESSPSGEDEFRYGGTILDGLYAVVPRALWPDKPLVAGYSDFVGRYTGIFRPDTDSTSVGVPQQFELYANGGAPFVVVGMFILTWLCARLERFVASCDRSLHVLMPSVMFLTAFGSGIEQLMLVLASALAGAGAVFAIARMIEVLFPQFLPQFRILKRGRQLGKSVAVTV
jgi:hypothetical protein